MDDETRKQMNVEETFAALDRIIGKLEKGDGSLEDAFADYEEGMKLVKSCNEKIETIEKKILVLSGDQTEEKENAELEVEIKEQNYTDRADRRAGGARVSDFGGVRRNTRHL